MKFHVALKTMDYLKWKKQFKEKLLGARIMNVKESTDWMPFADKESKMHHIRKITFNYEYAKYPWFFPGKEQDGFQIDNKESMPLKGETYLGAIMHYNSLISVVNKYNNRVDSINNHKQLRKDMGVS